LRRVLNGLPLNLLGYRLAVGGLVGCQNHKAMMTLPGARH